MIALYVSNQTLNLAYQSMALTMKDVTEPQHTKITIVIRPKHKLNVAHTSYTMYTYTYLISK